MCYANPFLHKEYNESFADYNLDLKLEVIKLKYEIVYSIFRVELLGEYLLGL